CPDDLLEAEVLHLAAPVHLVARGVEQGDLRHPGRSRLHGRPEPVPPGADGSDHTHSGHHDPAGVGHAGRPSRAVPRPCRATAANVSFALTAGSPSPSPTPRTMAAVEMTFSATTTNSSWSPRAWGGWGWSRAGPWRKTLPACF